VVVVVVWAKMYVVEVKVKVAWTDDVFVENLALSTRQCFAVRLVLLPCHHSKEVRSMDYIEDLLFLDF